MTPRERFALTLQHRNADRPPLDLGATTLTSMSAGCETRLREFLGFQGPPVPSNSGVDERILQWAGTDFRAVGAIVDLPSAHTRQISPTKHVSCWGITWEYREQDWQIVDSPLKGATLDDLKAFTWPEPRVPAAQLARWRADAQALHAADQYTVIAEHPVFGVLELGCWLCSYDDFLLRLGGDAPFVDYFMKKVLEIQLQVIEQYYAAVGPYIDLTTSGDDFGMQQAAILSPKMFARLIAPVMRVRIARTKEIADCYYWHHSCGSIHQLIGQLIDIGVDILNPIQTSATGMHPHSLKHTYGDRLVFWGGVDVQQFLPRATPAAVREHVTELIEVLGADGGYVVAGAHNLQVDVPPENIVALVETVRQYRSPARAPLAATAAAASMERAAR